jgi:glycosyltransferase involved in cell wall biosynthesis
MSAITVFYSMTMERFENRIFCVGAFGRFVDELSKQYDTVYLCAPVRDLAAPKDEYSLQSGNIILQAMPPYNSIVSSLRYAKEAHRALREYVHKWERLYIRFPSPFSLYAFSLAKRRNLPVFMHLVGDTRKVVEQGSKFNAIIRIAAQAYLAWAERALRHMIRHANHTLANGKDMRRFYRDCGHNVTEIRTSTFSEDEIFVRNSACSSSSILRLIYVGFLRHEKGLEYLIKALPATEHAVGKKVVLDIVGNGEIEDELKEMVISFGLQGSVNFCGYIPMGDRLSRLYRQADIFVLPSVSEGTPRVLLEAMANGLPVIATRVGGIPFTVEDGLNGLLIEPKDCEAIVGAVNGIAGDQALRAKIVAGGYQTARENTLEQHVWQVGEIIRNYSQGGGNS